MRYVVAKMYDFYSSGNYIAVTFDLFSHVQGMQTV